jgi:hypothetical protein
MLTNRLNTKLESKDLEPMTDLVKDFSNGVKLIEVRRDYFTSLRRCARHWKFVLTGCVAVGGCDLRRRDGLPVVGAMADGVLRRSCRTRAWGDITASR